jgi:methionyl aminopeptidase
MTGQPATRLAPSHLRANDPCWCGSGRKYKRCHRASEQPIRAGRVSPTRTVPKGIERPDYADTGMPASVDQEPIQTPEVIERMRRAGRVAGEVLDSAGRSIEPGMTGDQIDAIVHQATIDRGAYPSTLNYKRYPKSCCTSVNEVICHGIPDDRALRYGDIVNVDVTVFIEGVHGDTNATFEVGVVDEDSGRLLEVTRACLYDGIAAVRPGRPISDIGRAIQGRAAPGGYGIVRAFGGHGIGRSFHTALHIPHHLEPAATTVMEPNMVFTIEPMITLGTWRHRMWPDGWTAVTADGRRTAQYEHTVVVTDDGVEVLTPSQTLPPP